VDELLAGRLYVNVHTSANPGGEVRGQILSDTQLTIPFSATIEGAKEVPAVSSGAKGTGTFVLNSVRTELTFDITVDHAQLTGPIAAAHIHNAAAGVNGGVKRTLSFINGTASGTWKSTDTEALTATLVAELLAGRLYVNVHTSANPGGELRGQIVPDLVASGGNRLPKVPGLTLVGSLIMAALLATALFWILRKRGWRTAGPRGANG
jgi:hypothetical protein